MGLAKEIIPSINSKIIDRMTELDMLKEKEIQIKTLIIEKLAEIKLRAIYIEVGMGKIESFKVTQEASITNLSLFVNEHNFEGTFDAESDSYKQQKNIELNDLLILYSNNLKSLMRQFK